VALAELLRGAHPRQDPVPDVAHRVALLSGGLLYLFARMVREPRGGDGSVEQAVGVHMLANYVARFVHDDPPHEFTCFISAMQQERRPDAKRGRDEPTAVVTACSQLQRLANGGGQSTVALHAGYITARCTAPGDLVEALPEGRPFGWFQVEEYAVDEVALVAALLSSCHARWRRRGAHLLPVVVTDNVDGAKLASELVPVLQRFVATRYDPAATRPVDCFEATTAAVIRAWVELPTYHEETVFPQMLAGGTVPPVRQWLTDPATPICVLVAAVEALSDLHDAGDDDSDDDGAVAAPGGSTRWCAHLGHERIFTALVDRLSSSPPLPTDVASVAEDAIFGFLNSVSSADDEMITSLPAIVAFLRRDGRHPTRFCGMALAAFCRRQAAVLPMLHAAGFLGDALRRPLVEMQHFFGWLQNVPAHAAVVDDVIAAFADEPDAEAFRVGWANGTALHVAVAANNVGGHLERIVARAKRLAADGPTAACGFDIDAPPADYDGDTPLLTAVARGLGPAVRVLLHAGADPLRRNDRDLHAFFVAVEGGHVAVVEMMLSLCPKIKGDLESMEANGDPVLVVAIRSQYADIVRLLLAAGADPFSTEWAVSRRHAVVGAVDTQRLADMGGDAAIIAAVAAGRRSE
jgi:hypothetical protein